MYRGIVSRNTLSYIQPHSDIYKLFSTAFLCGTLSLHTAFISYLPECKFENIYTIILIFSVENYCDNAHFKMREAEGEKGGGKWKLSFTANKVSHTSTSYKL